VRVALAARSAMRALAARVRGLAGSPGGEAELEEELAFHLDMLEEEHRGRGLAPAAARAAARRDLGGVTQTREAVREQRGLPALESFVADVRYALRGLRRDPAFAVAAVATLALGIGADTAIFSVVDAVLLRPLPFPHAERIVFVGDEPSGTDVGNVGYATWVDWRQRSGAFDDLAVIRSWAPTLLGGPRPQRVPAMRVSWNYFRVLGVEVRQGRDFEPADDRPDGRHQVILSDRLWRQRFAGDPATVGSSLRLDGVEYRVAGVLPPDFEPLVSARQYEAADLWAPLGYDVAQPWACRSCQHLKAIGRLRPEVSPRLAAADLARIQQSLGAEHPGEYPHQITMGVVPLRESLSGRFRPVVLVLLGAVGFVLLIAAANVASLLLARALHRDREMALRLALGAGRGRLVRQLLTESLVLSLVGGAFGLGLACLGCRWLVALAPPGLPRADQIGVDGRMLAFTLAVCVGTGVLIGMAPALRSSAPGRGGALGTRGASGRSSHPARSALVVADIALALVLLAGAALMLRSVERLLAVEPGFDPRGVLTAQLSLVGDRYAEDAAVRDFQGRLLERVRALPGVEAAALAGQVPLGGNGDRWGFEIEGRPQANPADSPSLERYSVTPGYFRLMGIPLRSGRLLRGTDAAGAQEVLVVSESAASTLFPGEDPVGHRARIGGLHAPWRTIVGVVGDVRHRSLEPEPALQMYLPQAQLTDSYLVLAVRVDGERGGALVGPIREAVGALDPAVPVHSVATMEDLVARAAARHRFTLLLLGLFAATAVLMSAVGLYGVLAYNVSRRRGEVGVRLALGARGRDIVALLSAGGLALTGAGIALGIVAALLLTGFLRSLLFEVSASDPLTYAAVVALVGLVAVAAHVVPLGRAARLDPATALRHD
jgi:putative ABC transport system permease protein